MPLRSIAPNSAKLCVGDHTSGILLKSFEAMALPDTASSAINTSRFNIDLPFPCFDDGLTHRFLPARSPGGLPRILSAMSALKAPALNNAGRIRRPAQNARQVSLNGAHRPHDAALPEH